MLPIVLPPQRPGVRAGHPAVHGYLARHGPVHLHHPRPYAPAVLAVLATWSKLNPQTVLFLGYSDNSANATAVDVTQTDRTFFVKLGYAWAF